MRTIFLPATGNTISLATYVAGVKTAIQNPTLTYPNGLSSWGPTSGSAIRRQFRRAMHQRISDGVPYTDRGRQIEHDEPVVVPRYAVCAIQETGDPAAPVVFELPVGRESYIRLGDARAAMGRIVAGCTLAVEQGYLPKLPRFVVHEVEVVKDDMRLSGGCDGVRACAECEYERDPGCACEVCVYCGDHKGMARCWCGWSLSGRSGRDELVEMGENLDGDY